MKRGPVKTVLRVVAAAAAAVAIVAVAVVVVVVAATAGARNGVAAVAAGIVDSFSVSYISVRADAHVRLVRRICLDLKYFLDPGSFLSAGAANAVPERRPAATTASWPAQS